MIEPDSYILADINFIKYEEGGRKNLFPIKNDDYTYRPIFYFDNDKKNGYCSALIIGDYLKGKINDFLYKDVKIMFLKPNVIRDKANNCKTFFLTEGLTPIAKGIIKDISHL